MREERLAPRWRDVRVPYAVPLALGMCAAAFGSILYLSRTFSFYYDEWDFVLAAPRWTLRSYFVPHSEHWYTFAAVVYELLFTAVGMRSYLPFTAALLLVHASVAFLLFLVVRRRSGDLLGLAAAAMVLFLGRGFENVLWAFQIGFLGSIAFGLAAIYLLDRPSSGRLRQAIACAGLLLSVASSGVGLFFCAAVGVDLVLDPSRRRYLWTLAIPGAAYAAWYLELG